MPTGSKGEKGEQVTRNVSYTDRLVRCELYDKLIILQNFLSIQDTKIEIIVLLLVQEEA